MPDLPRTLGAASLALALSAVVPGCSTVEATVHEPLPAVSVVEGADKAAPKTLTLTPDAVRRLEIATQAVAGPTAVPWAAVVYDKKGAPWVYSSPKDRTFIRVPVTIERIDGDVARLSAGPPSGTLVVTHAAIKLYGAETGVGGGH